jgi:hypothetical protein
MVEALVTPILQGLGVVLAGALVVIARRFMKKLGFELDEKAQQQLESLARQAALWVEEEAKRRIFAGLAKMTPDEKEEAGVAKMRAWSPDVDPVRASEMLKAVLPTLGLGASGKSSGTPVQ